MSIIAMKSNNHTVRIELNDTKTAAEIAAKLPLYTTMERFDDREYYTVLDFTPTQDGEKIADFTNGDVAYYPPYNSLAVFFARDDESSCPDLIRIGRILSELTVFETLDDKIDVIIESEP